MPFYFYMQTNLHIFAVTSTIVTFIKQLMFTKILINMETSTLKSKKVSLPSATLREMKPGMSIKLTTVEVKTSTLRMAASKLKKEGYLFRVSDRGLINETIVECIKTPTL